jgi:hypothetical protein
MKTFLRHGKNTEQELLSENDSEDAGSSDSDKGIHTDTVTDTDRGHNENSLLHVAARFIFAQDHEFLKPWEETTSRNVSPVQFAIAFFFVSFRESCKFFFCFFFEKKKFPSKIITPQLGNVFSFTH